MEATELVLAAKDGDIERVEKLLKLFPSQIDVRRNGCTALHAASRAGYIDIMKTLIFHDPKPDLDFPDSKDSTPLHYAVKADRPEAVLLLLKNGAKSNEEDDDGKTAYDIACERKYEDCINAFKERGNKTQQSVPYSSSDDEDQNQPENKEIQAEHKKTKKCKFCNHNSRIIRFEPCECLISCFECSVKRDKCKCDKFIEKRTFDRTVDSEQYGREVKFMRIELENTRKRIQELEEERICMICTQRVINCTLSCGHMFCIPCVRRTKDEKTRRPNEHWICSLCQISSRYTKLFPPWGNPE